MQQQAHFTLSLAAGPCGTARLEEEQEEQGQGRGERILAVGLMGETERLLLSVPQLHPRLLRWNRAVVLSVHPVHSVCCEFK